MPCTAKWYSFPSHMKWVLQVPHCVAEPWLLLVSLGGIDAPRRISCEDWLQLQQRSSCARVHPKKQDLLPWNFGAHQVHPLGVSLVELVGWNLVWSEAVYWVHWPWGLSRSRKSTTTYALVGPLRLSYRAICRCRPLVLGFERSRRGQAVNLGGLPLAPGH